MEEIVGVFFSAIGRTLWWLFVYFLFDIVLYNVGCLFLFIVTAGRYPRGVCSKKDEEHISWAGMGAVFLVWPAIALYNNYA